MQIIPAIDIIDGKCVRLLTGDYGKQTTYAKTPVEMAQYFESCGVDKIHVVDLDGAKRKQLMNTDVIQSICSAVKIPVEVGGGIRTSSDVQTLFEIGAAQVVIGSLAVQQPEIVKEFVQQFGPERIIAGVDLLNGVPKISGWLEGSEINLDELFKQILSIGVRTVNVTDIDRDGTLTSPNLQLSEELVKKYPSLNIVASGGVSSADDVKKLQAVGVAGVIIGKAIYENTLNLAELC